MPVLWFNVCIRLRVRPAQATGRHRIADCKILRKRGEAATGTCRQALAAVSQRAAYLAREAMMASDTLRGASL